MKLEILLAAIMAVLAMNAPEHAEAARVDTPACTCPTPGNSPGRYPSNSMGAPVFMHVRPPPEPPTDDLAEFNRTRLLGERRIVMRSPHETEPVDESNPIIQVGVVNRTGGITRTNSPTRDARGLRESAPEGIEGERNLNVFLPDTRAEVNEFAYPYRTVGKWRGCTATLVRDSGIVVTNAHCLAYLSNGQMDPAMWSAVFYAGLNNGAFLKSSSPKAIYYDKDDDYAVLKLWNNIDAQLGRMGAYWRDEDFFDTDRPLSMISYSGDHCTSWNTCRQKLATGKSRGTVWIGNDVKHDLDAKRGSSGSAMWRIYSGGIPVMEALNWGEDRNGGDASLTFNSYTGSNPNYAKPGEVWKVGYDKVKKY